VFWSDIEELIDSTRKDFAKEIPDGGPPNHAH